MKLLLYITFSLINLSAFSQVTDRKPAQYKKFSGEITLIDKQTIRFGTKILFISNTDEKLISIFTTGILYPEIFDYVDQKQAPDLQMIDTENVVVVKVKKGLLAQYLNLDSLRISDFKVIDNSDNRKNILKFSCLIFRNKVANPTYYEFELENDININSSDIEIFISNAKLKSINKGSIQI